MGRLVKIALSLFLIYASMPLTISPLAPLSAPFMLLFWILVWPVGALLVRREADPDRLLRYCLVVLGLSLVGHVLVINPLSGIVPTSQLPVIESIAVHYAIRLPVFLGALYAAKRVVYDGALPVENVPLSR